MSAGPPGGLAFVIPPDASPLPVQPSGPDESAPAAEPEAAPAGDPADVPTADPVVKIEAEADPVAADEPAADPGQTVDSTKHRRTKLLDPDAAA